MHAVGIALHCLTGRVYVLTTSVQTAISSETKAGLDFFVNSSTTPHCSCKKGVQGQYHATVKQLSDILEYFNLSQNTHIQLLSSYTFDDDNLMCFEVRDSHFCFT